MNSVKKEDSFRSKPHSMVKVAMITHNGHRHFKEQLESILMQSIPCDIEIFDDCSSDHFVEQLKRTSKEHPEVVIHLSPKNQGVIGNIKKAIGDAQEPYIALSDQDDVWFPDKIEVTLEAIQAIEELGLPTLVDHDMSIIDQGGNLKPLSFWEVMRQNTLTRNFEANVVTNLVTGSASLLNNELTKFAKDIPEDLDIYHDAWLGMVAHTMGKTTSIYKTLSQHRQHTGSLTFSQKTKDSILTRLTDNVLQILGLAKPFDGQFLFIDRFMNTYYTQLDQYHKNYFKSFLSLQNKSYWAKKRFVLNALKKNNFM